MRLHYVIIDIMNLARVNLEYPGLFFCTHYVICGIMTNYHTGTPNLTA